MKYGLISIDMGSVNLGNRLIEYATQKVLNLPDPAIKISMFKTPTEEEIVKLNKMNFVLVPGSTALAHGAGQSEALDYVARISVPVFCVGVSGWAPAFHYHTHAIRYMTPPLGVRDPLTLKKCHKYQVRAYMVGCTTMHLPKINDATKPSVEFTCIGFSRENQEWQHEMFRIHSDNRRYVSMIQEGTGIEPHLSREFSKEEDRISYSNPEEVMNYYARCTDVITGRLHGVLPAMSQHKPVAFFGDFYDSRFSLLRFIGIKISYYNKMHYIEFVSPDKYINNIKILREALDEWIFQAKMEGFKNLS